MWERGKTHQMRLPKYELIVLEILDNQGKTVLRKDLKMEVFQGESSIIIKKENAEIVERI
jgi:hypothetical protein